MRRISLLVFTAALILCGGPTMADDHPGGGKTNGSAEFAHTTFPLPEQPSFEADLAALEDVVAAKIEHPVPTNALHDRVLGYELKHYLELVQKWPAQKFREPLVKLFKTNPDFKSGEALLAYRDTKLTKLVDSEPGMRTSIERLKSLRNDEPTVDYLARTMWGNKKPINHSATHFDPAESLLPGWKDELLRELKWPDAMTVARAASQLRDNDISVRLQSWMWLAEQGIIAPTEVVLESWSRLTEKHKGLISEVRPKFLGRRRLIVLFEQLLFIELATDNSPSMQKYLRLGQVRLGNVLSTTEARRVLKSAWKRPDFPDGMTDAEVDALQIVCTAPAIWDTAMLIQARKAKNKRIVLNALDGLCRIDHPDAIDAVGEFLAAPVHDSHYSSVVNLIQQQSVLELQNRDQYLAVLAPALRACLKRDFGKHIGERWLFEDLVKAFECMSGQDFSKAALAEQNKMVRGVTFGVGWNSSKGLSTHGSCTYANLPTATAAVSLRWYDKKISAAAKP